jgi:hypothetical protein
MYRVSRMTINRWLNADGIERFGSTGGVSVRVSDLLAAASEKRWKISST